MRRVAGLLVILYFGAVIFVALATARCVKGNKAVGHDQAANPKNRTDSTAGRDVWNFNLQSVSQSATGGIATLTTIGWAVAGYGRRREMKSLNKIAECTEDCDDCKTRVRHLRDPYVNHRIVRHMHPQRKT